ncbi:MAG: pilus assembly PilX N-terminal domain-containing protein [Methylococcales bacterium]
MLKQYKYSNKKQRGVVLVLSLLFLVILTLIGISSAKTSVLQEKIAGHSGLQQAAFQAADSCTNRVLNDSGITDATKNNQQSNLFDGAEQYLVSNSMTNRSAYKAQQLYTGETSALRGTGSSLSRVMFIHNEYRCQGLTENSAVNVQIRQGTFRIIPKSTVSSKS